jgi:hypothetical protein
MIHHDQNRCYLLLRDTGASWSPADDLDFTDPANLAAVQALPIASLPPRTVQGHQMALFVEAYDSSDAVLAGAGASFDLTIYRVISPHEVEMANPAGLSLGIPNVTRVARSGSVSTTLHEIVTIETGQVDRFTVGLSNVSNMPAGTDRLRIFWRME